MHYLSAVKKSFLKNKIVILRLDFNTEDDWRMRAALPTVKFLHSRCKAVLILSHRGRPSHFEKGLSLKKDAVRLGDLLKRKVIFIPNFDFDAAKIKINSAKEGSIFVLENLRFVKGESNNDTKLAKKLAELGDVYVNDAFAVSHRENASIVGITKYLPSFAGHGLELEIKNLERVMSGAERPLVMIFGGAKVGDKLGVLKRFKEKADVFLVGGALANTLLALRGLDIGRSIVEKKAFRDAKQILEYKNIVLPKDFAKADSSLLDIGKESIMLFSRYIAMAKTVVWNGPMGLIEKDKFRRGTAKIAEAIIANKKCFSVVGGGETIMFLKKIGLDKKIGFISTGGGAMIEYLSGKELPGLRALERAK